MTGDGSNASRLVRCFSEISEICGKPTTLRSLSHSSFIFAQNSAMNRIVIVLTALVFITSCAAKRTWEADKIKKQEAALLSEAEKGKVDTAAVNDLLAAYEGYAAKYPTDTVGANFLFKAADFYRYMGKPLRSVGLYEQIYNNYPTFERRPYALFLQGFIFENEVHNEHTARIKYHDFLKQYPDHPIANDVRLSMQNLGKTPEQLMAEFEAKQKADSVAVNP